MRDRDGVQLDAKLLSTYTVTRPVRLTDIARVGVAGWPAPEWREVPPGECVHGCLTSRGAFAIYDAVALVAFAERAR